MHAPYSDPDSNNKLRDTERERERERDRQRERERERELQTDREREKTKYTLYPAPSLLFILAHLFFRSERETFQFISIHFIDPK